MRDPARIQRIVEKLRAAWLAQEDLRLTQLIINLHRDKQCPLCLVVLDVTERALDALVKAVPQ